MHPLIAFLTFIFSSNDDWLMKKAFELVIDPAHVEATVESYDRLGKTYPSRFKTARGNEVDADLAAKAVFAEAMWQQGRSEQALALWNRLEKDKRLPPELQDETNLRIGEALLALGKSDQAVPRFTALAAKALNPHRIDAEVNLLICDLARGDGDAALLRAESIRAYAEHEPLAFRAALPMGLADYAAGRFEDAVVRLGTVENEPRARYFQAMALRRLAKPSDEIAQWQALRGSKDPAWAQIGEMQLAETYFSLGDDGISRQVAERALARSPESAVATLLSFRIASIDFRAGNFDGALARLEPLVKGGDLAKRSTVLMAESLAKTGRSKELFDALAKMPDMKKTAEGAYQTAWAAMIEKRFDEAIATSDRGLTHFRDEEFTPRLLLLQGLAFEYIGKTPEALASYQTVSDRFPETHAAAYSAHWATMAYLRLNRPIEAATHGAFLFARVPEAIQRQVPDAAFWIAEAHLRMKRWDDADKNYARFIQIADPANERLSNALFQRTVTLAQMRRPADALAMLDAFQRQAQQEKKPGLVSFAHLQRGNILFNERQFAPAVAAYRAAGDNAKAEFQTALALYRMDYVTDAVETWTKLADAKPKDPYGEKAAFRAGRATFELGHATAAVALYAKYLERYPAGANAKAARLQSAHALFNAGDAAGALPLYAEYLIRYRDTDDLAEVSPYYATCLLQTGKTADEAELAMKGLPPTEGMAAIVWGEGAKHFNEKSYDDASRRFTTLAYAMPAYENSAPALFYRAESLYQKQAWFEAEGAYNSYLGLQAEADRDPTQAATALFHRGVSAFNQDHLLDAAASFAEVARAFPSSPLARDAATNLVLCFHHLGDFATSQRLREAHGLDKEQRAPLPLAPDFEVTLDGEANEPMPRGMTEIPRDLSLRKQSFESTGSEMAGDLSRVSLPNP